MRMFKEAGKSGGGKGAGMRMMKERMRPAKPRGLPAAALIAAAIIWNLAGGARVEAATPMIGTAVANGSFRVDSMTVKGNATLFEGVTVETGAISSTMQLASGARMILGAESRGRIFGDHLVLERGQGQLDKPSGFRVEARGLTIQPETGNTTGRVQLAGANRVQVAAVTGSFRVLNSRGMLVARLPQGAAIAFEPQAIPTFTRISGRLDVKAGHYLLTDETTQVTIEIVGKDLAKSAGKRVEVSGSLDPAVSPTSDASQLVRVQNLRLLAQATPPAPAAAGGAGSSSASGAAGSAGASGAAGSVGAGAGGAAAAGTAAAGAAGATVAGVAVTTVAIVGGVAAAATIGGLAASGAIGGGSTPVSR